MTTAWLNPGPCACGNCEGFSCEFTEVEGELVAGCVCTDQERMVRNVARGFWNRFHSPDQRVALIEVLRGSVIVHGQRHEPLEQRSDQALAEATLEYWTDCSRCKAGL